MAVTGQVLTDRYATYCGDCMEVMGSFPDARMGFSIYSPPFANTKGGLYHYSSSERDLSNSRTYGEFLEHYQYVVREIHRITAPGRMTAVHCMDVPTGNTGCDGFIDFAGDIIRMHCRCEEPGCTASERERAQGLCGHGPWSFTARHHVWKEPLEVRNRTMTKGLAHRTIVEDSSRCSVAAADQLLIFRRSGTNAEPIAHPSGLLDYAGARPIPAELMRYRGWKGPQTKNRYSHWIWRQYASSFWDDIRLDRVLPYRKAREEEDERHVHPLQLDVIERALTLWSNPGDRVWTPFSGVGSELFTAVRMGRFGLGAELKPSYWRQGVANLETVDMPLSEQPILWEATAGLGD